MLQNVSYCPILISRVAEIKALEQLPAATKDRMFPIVVARPWPNAKALNRVFEKISEALSTRRYGLDLDDTKCDSLAENEAAKDFASLFNARAGFEAYYKKVAELPFAIPVLRSIGGDFVGLTDQASHVANLDRGALLRLRYGVTRTPIAALEKILRAINDVTIIIDVGWGRDLLSREAWASQIIERITSEYPETEMVVSGSSFPDSFSDVGRRGVISVSERSLYDNLVRRHNAASLVYGDWGSTRPPSAPVPMRNIPRIDLPTSGEWIAFRRDANLDTEEDYGDIARRVVADRAWPSDLRIWGTYAVESTAENAPGAIRSPAVAAAARINIHMHRQAFFGANIIVSDGDEPFLDD